MQPFFAPPKPTFIRQIASPCGGVYQPPLTTPLFRTLVPLFAVQFLSWAGMFCMWIYAVPVIAGDVFRAEGNAARMGTAMAAIGGCYALYAILGASLAFVMPRALAKMGVRVTYAAALMVGACGIGALGVIDQSIWLIPAFVAVGIGWAAIGNLPYAVLSAAVPEGKGAHLMRVFGFSTVAPQAICTLLLAFVGPRLSPGDTHYVMLAGGALMAGAAVLVLIAGGHFTVHDEEW